MNADLKDRVSGLLANINRIQEQMDPVRPQVILCTYLSALKIPAEKLVLAKTFLLRSVALKQKIAESDLGKIIVLSQLIGIPLPEDSDAPALLQEIQALQNEAKEAGVDELMDAMIKMVSEELCTAEDMPTDITAGKALVDEQSTYNDEIMQCVDDLVSRVNSKRGVGGATFLSEMLLAKKNMMATMQALLMVKGYYTSAEDLEIKALLMKCMDPSGTIFPLIEERMGDKLNAFK